MNSRSRGEERLREQRLAIARVQRNFWVLVAATIVAVGVLTQAVKEPSRPATAALVAVSGLAAIVSLALAGRILVVTTARLLPRRRGRPRT